MSIGRARADFGGDSRPLRLMLDLMVLLVALALPGAASAKVFAVFHSFNGSVLVGRYPHTFIELSGTLDSTGQSVEENYGYTATRITPAILAGNVKGTIESENEHYVRTTNVHFRVPITDQKYHEIVAEVAKWRDSPSNDYNLDHNNCVSFVARIARMIGLNADVPQALIRRPKAWLNYVVSINPQLRGTQVR